MATLAPSSLQSTLRAWSQELSAGPWSTSPMAPPSQYSALHKSKNDMLCSISRQEFTLALHYEKKWKWVIPFRVFFSLCAVKTAWQKVLTYCLYFSLNSYYHFSATIIFIYNTFHKHLHVSTPSHSSTPAPSERASRAVFPQIATQVLQKPARELRCPSRAWKVNLVGEGADDAGGVYDDTIAQICEVGGPFIDEPRLVLSEWLLVPPCGVTKHVNDFSFTSKQKNAVVEVESPKLTSYTCHSSFAVASVVAYITYLHHNAYLNVVIVFCFNHYRNWKGVWPSF